MSFRDQLLRQDGLDSAAETESRVDGVMRAIRRDRRKKKAIAYLAAFSWAVSLYFFALFRMYEQAEGGRLVTYLGHSAVNGHWRPDPLKSGAVAAALLALAATGYTIGAYRARMRRE